MAQKQNKEIKGETFSTLSVSGVHSQPGIWKSMPIFGTRGFEFMTQDDFYDKIIYC